jgi:hypothetical protein
MISKENFVKYMEKLQEFRKIEDAINEVTKDLDFFTVTFIEHEILILTILEDIFGDKENTWISYFMFDLDFGAKWKVGMITEDGKDVPMRNAEELYDVLIGNMSKDGNK